MPEAARILPEISGEFSPPDREADTRRETSRILYERILRDVAISSERRFEHLVAIEQKGLQELELELCAADGLYWLHWWGWTFDPRLPLEDPPFPAYMPFDLAPRQVELWKWFEFILSERTDGCCKKSRGIGFTWLAGALAWHKWRWTPGFKTSFVSRTVTEVDQLGNSDSILEKVRLLYNRLPKWMLPVGFKPVHDKHLLIINPDNGNVIRGEGGDEAGRGGRNSMFVIDEASRIPQADRVDSATSANTSVRIWGSSINPQNENNLFARKYNSMRPEYVFRFHYSELPDVWTPERLASRKLVSTDEIWASEFEIDDSYTAEDICIPAAWVTSAVKLKGLCAKLRREQEVRLSRLATLEQANPTDPEVTSLRQECQEFSGRHGERGLLLQPRVDGVAGGDVGGGKAKSVVVARFGPVVAKPSSWLDPDTIDTAHKMLDYCLTTVIPPREDGFQPKIKTLRYDSVMIGQGVANTLKRNPKPGLITVGVNVGQEASETKWPDGEYAHEKFFNCKAEGWMTAREAFKRTHEMTLWLLGLDGGHRHPLDVCLSLPDDPSDQQLARLIAQLSQVKYNRRENGKIQIEDKKSLSRRGLASPDYADAFILTFCGQGKAERWVAFSKVHI